MVFSNSLFLLEVFLEEAEPKVEEVIEYQPIVPVRMINRPQPPAQPEQEAKGTRVSSAGPRMATGSKPDGERKTTHGYATRSGGNVRWEG
jgi:hypothetical protein